MKDCFLFLFLLGIARASVKKQAQNTQEGTGVEDNLPLKRSNTAKIKRYHPFYIGLRAESRNTEDSRVEDTAGNAFLITVLKVQWQIKVNNAKEKEKLPIRHGTSNNLRFQAEWKLISVFGIVSRQ